MKILPISLNISKEAVFGKKHPKKAPALPQETEDVFVKREDNYTKKYKELVLNADKAYQNAKTDKDENKKPPLSTADIKFLLDIKDYDKFKTLITTPVILKQHEEEERTNIFFYTNADATKQLAKKLNDRSTLKKLLLQRTGRHNNTVFHDMAANNHIKKAKVLQQFISAKEFKKFFQSNNYCYDTPYSICEEKNNDLYKYIRPLFIEEI